jgi:hypothetical protein
VLDELKDEIAQEEMLKVEDDPFESSSSPTPFKQAESGGHVRKQTYE